ncbi:MAG: penicillin-binding protein [Bryobacteraceae bacterium]|nr:penicillin-binding protein [Bryobacteraceae bacterium]
MLSLALGLVFCLGAQTAKAGSGPVAQSKSSAAQSTKAANQAGSQKAAHGAQSRGKSAAQAKSSAAKNTKSSKQTASNGAAQTKTAGANRAAIAASATTRAPARTSAKAPARKTRIRRWTEPTFADSTIGDRLDGEDLTVRRAAVQALGRYNGSVVVVDPDTGRILSMVNQKAALSAAFQPCSTVKIPVAMAALAEGMIDRSTVVRVASGRRLTLTEALARSDNRYFASLGDKLGFERVSYYARLMGLGEKAGWRIEGEQPGTLPEAPPPEGVGMMSSFGSGITMTPLQLASMLVALANGGTLYYLQYPRTNEELRDFTPRVKRFLHIEPWLQELQPGMLGAVEFGTARRASFDPDAPIYGKTGTCSDRRTHLGWFGSYAEIAGKKLVVVVLLTGGAGVGGSVAAEIAGNTYRLLSQEGVFPGGDRVAEFSRVSAGACCTP